MAVVQVVADVVGERRIVVVQVAVGGRVRVESDVAPASHRPCRGSMHHRRSTAHQRHGRAERRAVPATRRAVPRTETAGYHEQRFR